MSENLHYQSLDPIERVDAEAVFVSGSPEDIGRAILRVALHDPDWEYAERAALAHLAYPHVWVRRNAATSLGHIARIHRRLHTGRVIPALLQLAQDPEVCGYAGDALDDCEIFLAIRRADFEE